MRLKGCYVEVLRETAPGLTGIDLYQVGGCAQRKSSLRRTHAQTLQTVHLYVQVRMPGSKAQEPGDAKRGQHANRAAVMCLNIAADRDSHQHFKNRSFLLADVRVIPLSIASGGRLCNATYDVDYSKERTTLRAVGGNRTLLLTPCHGCAKFTLFCRRRGRPAVGALYNDITPRLGWLETRILHIMLRSCNKSWRIQKPRSTRTALHLSALRSQAPWCSNRPTMHPHATPLHPAGAPWCALLRVHDHNLSTDSTYCCGCMFACTAVQLKVIWGRMCTDQNAGMKQRDREKHSESTCCGRILPIITYRLLLPLGSSLHNLSGRNGVAYVGTNS